MSDTYTKLFSSITESTVWSEAYSTRIVWVTLLAMVDQHGCAYASIPGLARRANVTVDEARVAIDSFLAPDPDSRTKDNEGRRIVEIDGGWKLINHGKYDQIRNSTERKEYKREWDRTNRAKHEPTDPDVIRQDPTVPTLDPVPYVEITAAYNRAMRDLVKVRKLNPKRKTLIRRAWQADKERRSMMFWNAYFDECQDDNFLNGTGPYRNGHENWRPTFDYLLREDVITKTYEKAMDRIEREA